MKLNDREIRNLIEEGRIGISPVDLEKQVQPCSIDLRLGYSKLEYEAKEGTVIDVKETDLSDITTEEKLDSWGLVIEPGDFHLLTTYENVHIPPWLESDVRGRSSLGRLGLKVHSTAGLVDPGYDGQVTLEVTNEGKYPVRVYPEMRFCQLTFDLMSEPASEPYGMKENSKYQGQTGAVESRISDDFSA